MNEEWFYLWRYGLTDSWHFAGYLYGNRYQAQLLVEGLAYGWRVTDSSNLDVYPPEAPTFSANVPLSPLSPAQSLGIEQLAWSK